MPTDPPYSPHDYYATCVKNGMSHDAAAALCEGLRRARQRVKDGKPGWETLAHSTPQPVRQLCRQLFALAAKSNPSTSNGERLASSIQAVFAYGLLAGMLAADAGHGPNEDEILACEQNRPDLWDRIVDLAGEKES